MNINLISLFPEMFQALNYGITGRAQRENKIHLSFWNPRDFTVNKTGRVDDKPYGGGPGMVMQVQPIRACINKIKNNNINNKTIYLSPQGKLITQDFLKNFINNFNPKNNQLNLLCGRYEGIDERIIEHDIDEEWSIGNYILSGGELAAMVIIEAMTRLLLGVLGNDESALQDSFSETSLLDYPHYTRPEEIDGQIVPAVLLSGNHTDILNWRKKQAILNTRLKRPDLI